MLDPNIITRGAELAQIQQQRNFDSLGELGGSLGRLVLGRRINQMQQLKPEQRQEFANNSIFAPFLNTQLRVDEAAALKSKMEQERHVADIGNTNAQALERTANAGDITQKTTINRQRAISGALAAALSGDPQAVSFMLEQGKTGGIIDSDSYARANRFLLDNKNNPEAIASLVKSLGIAGAEKPEQYIQPDANTVANNVQSDLNSQRTYDASIYGTRVGAETADKDRVQEQNQFEQNFEYTAQQDEIKNGQGEIKEFGGKAWIVYKDGTYRPAVGVDGKQISASKTETPEQKMVRVDSALGSADAAKAAARASQDAAGLINDMGLYWGTGATNWLGNIPGTDAKAFHAKLENLKSQVFLPAVKALQGMGALSNAEGEKISASIANLDPKISPEAMKQQLTVLAKQMSDAAKLANQRTRNYASRGGTIPLNSKANTSNVDVEPETSSYKGVTIPLSKVKELAQQAGLSTQEAIKRFQSQGLIIK